MCGDVVEGVGLGVFTEFREEVVDLVENVLDDETVDCFFRGIGGLMLLQGLVDLAWAEWMFCQL